MLYLQGTWLHLTSPSLVDAVEMHSTYKENEINFIILSQREQKKVKHKWQGRLVFLFNEERPLIVLSVAIPLPSFFSRLV